MTAISSIRTNVQTTIQQFNHFASQGDYDAALNQLNLLKNQMPQQLFDKIVKLMTIEDNSLASLEKRKIEVNKENLSFIDEMIRNNFLEKFGMKIPQKDEKASSSLEYLSKKYQFKFDEETLGHLSIIGYLAHTLDPDLAYCPYIQLVQMFIFNFHGFISHEEQPHRDSYCEAMTAFYQTNNPKKLIRFIEDTMQKTDETQDVVQALIHLLKHLPNDFLYECPGVGLIPLVARTEFLTWSGVISYYAFKQVSLPFITSSMYLLPHISPEQVIEKWGGVKFYRDPSIKPFFDCITNFEKDLFQEFSPFQSKLLSVVMFLRDQYMEMVDDFKEFWKKDFSKRDMSFQLVDAFEYFENVNEWINDQIPKFKEKIKFIIDFEIYIRIHSLEAILSNLKGKNSVEKIKHLKAEMKEFFHKAALSKEMREKIGKLKKEDAFLKYGGELARSQEKLDKLMSAKSILEVNLNVMRRYNQYLLVDFTTFDIASSKAMAALTRNSQAFQYSEIQLDSMTFNISGKPVEAVLALSKMTIDLTARKTFVVKEATLKDRDLVFYLRELPQMKSIQHAELDEILAKLKIEEEALLASLPLIPIEKLETKKVDEPETAEVVTSSKLVAPFCLQSHMKLIQKEFSAIHLSFKHSQIELSASLENAEHHLHNLFVLLERTFQQLADPSRSGLFSTLISSISEGTLVIEQLLRSVDLLYHPLKENESLNQRYTHNLHALFKRSFMKLNRISHKDIELIYGLDRGEIYSRNIANFLDHAKRKNRLNYAKELLNMIYKWHNQMDKVTLDQVLKEMITYYNDLFVVIFKLFSSFEKRESNLEVAKLNRLSDLIKTYSMELETVFQQNNEKLQAPAAVNLQEPLLKVINKLKRVLSFLIKKDKSGMFSANFENILNNHMTRLVAELERQPTLSAKEIRLHYSTILQLNEFIAKEILECYLTLLEKDFSKGASLQKLIQCSGCTLKQFSKIVRQFLKREKTRNLIRYDGENRLITVKNKQGKQVQKAMQKSATLVHHTLSLNPEDGKDGFETVLHEKGKDLVEIRTLASEDVYLTVRLLAEVIKIVEGHDVNDE